MVRATYRSASKKGDAALRPLSFAHHPAGVSVNQRGSVEPLRAGWFVVVVPRHKDNSSDNAAIPSPNWTKCIDLWGHLGPLSHICPPLCSIAAALDMAPGTAPETTARANTAPPIFLYNFILCPFKMRI